MKLTDKEEEILGHINAAYAGIHELGLKCNHQELADAIHRLQFFVIMAGLQREDPEKWNSWYVFNTPTRS